MHKKKEPVILAINTMYGGGAERVVIDLARNWPLPDHPPIILLAERRGQLLEAIPGSIEVLEVGVSPAVKNTPAFLLALRKVIGLRAPIAVISHLTAMNRMMVRAKVARAFNARVIVVEHNNADLNAARKGFGGELARLETSWLYRRADGVVGVSQGVIAGVRKHYGLPDSIGEVIYNPIDTQAIQHLASQRPEGRLPQQVATLPRPLLLAAGRLHPQKDFGTLIQAFHTIAANIQGSLVILGEGEQRSALEGQIAALGLTRRVLLPGHVANPWWYMGMADLFVLSSRWEGYGNVLVEAMACGTPILATDCPYGPAEIVEGFRSGMLVPVCDSKKLAVGITKMLAGAPEARLPSYRSFERVSPAQSARSYAAFAIPGLLGGVVHK